MLAGFIVSIPSKNAGKWRQHINRFGIQSRGSSFARSGLGWRSIVFLQIIAEIKGCSTPPGSRHYLEYRYAGHCWEEEARAGVKPPISRIGTLGVVKRRDGEGSRRVENPVVKAISVGDDDVENLPFQSSPLWWFLLLPPFLLHRHGVCIHETVRTWLPTFCVCCRWPYRPWRGQAAWEDIWHVWRGGSAMIPISR